MAEFEGAVQNTMLLEGGYVNDPRDNGGETYEGISRKTWPSWPGWSLIDALKHVGTLPKDFASHPELTKLVVAFYHDHYWLYDGVNDQATANKIFDLAVNVGQVHAHKIVQHAAGVKDDGLWGKETEDAVNGFASSKLSLINAIRIGAADYHRSIVQTHPEDAAFLAGWLRRDQA